MQPQSDGDYQQLLTTLIKKQIVILGPDITLAKARNVRGLTIADDGSVTNMSGNPQELIQALIEQFVELSGLIVKKTMEPLLANYPGLMNSLGATAAVVPQVMAQPVVPPPAQTTTQLQQPAQPAPQQTVPPQQAGQKQ